VRKFALLALGLSLLAITGASAGEPEKIIVPRYKFSYQPGGYYYYYSTPPRFTQDELDEFSDKIADKVVDKLLKKLADDEKVKPGDPPGTVQPKISQAPAPKAQKVAPDLQYLTQNCSTCHGPQGTIRGGFRLFAPDGTISADVDWWKVWERTTTEDVKMRMPPGKPRAPQSVTDSIVNRARNKK
jgi:mono/diheme cytochrome c family protein